MKASTLGTRHNLLLLLLVKLQSKGEQWPRAETEINSLSRGGGSSIDTKKKTRIPPGVKKAKGRKKPIAIEKRRQKKEEKVVEVL